ncbi:MAG: sialidase family protein, partial [Flavobacteriales bacterium]
MKLLFHTQNRKLLLLQIAFLLLTGILSEITNAQIENTLVSNGLFFDGEPYLAVNPDNNQNLVVAWMGVQLNGGLLRVAIKTRMSLNGGTTWSATTSLPHFGEGYGSADVSMAFNTSGILFISYIDYKQQPDSGGIYVARSFDNGLNWDMPVKAFDMYDIPDKRPIDRPWLVVDNSNSINQGTLYITTKPAPWIPAPNRNYFKVSSDNGFTWSSIANLDGENYLIGNAIAAPMAAPTTTQNGLFCSVYPSYVISQNPLPAFYFASSPDKGQSFNYHTVLAALPSTIDSNLKSAYRLIANPIDTNAFAFLYLTGENGDSDIMAIHSLDGGQTWNTPVRANDDPIGNGKDQDLVWAAYNEQGNLAVSWRDRRNASENGFWNSGYDMYYTVSDNNAESFSLNQKLTNQFISFDTLISENGNDMMSCAYSEDTLYSVWGDTRNGRMSVYFAKTIASSNTTVNQVVLDGEETSWNIFPN